MELAKPIESSQIDLEQLDAIHSSDEEQQLVHEEKEKKQEEIHKEMPTQSLDYQLTRDRSKR